MTIHRSDRLADVVHRALAEIVQHHLRDPRVGFVTLTGVKLSPDLRHARVYVSQVVADADVQSSLDALNHATPFLRRELARRARLRFTPRLRFYEDSGVRRGVRVEELLDQVTDDLHPPGEEPEDGR
jgi:ribosome-binding factor A